MVVSMTRQTGRQPSRQTGQVDRSNDRDLITYTLLTTVAAAAAVMSFAAWSGLAGLVGIHDHVGPLWLNWLLPISVDAYALTATRVWLHVRHISDSTRQWAARNAVGAILLSFAGNALYHLVPVLGMTTWSTWWAYVVMVSGLPAVMFGLSVHLIVQVRQDQTEAGQGDQTDLSSQTTEQPAQPRQSTGPVQPDLTAALPTRPVQRPTRPATVTTLPSQAEDWNEWMDRLRSAYPDSLPSQYVIRQMGANATKAKKLRLTLAAERESTPGPVPVRADQA